jgi:hypothetical protein
MNYNKDEIDDLDDNSEYDIEVTPEPTTVQAAPQRNSLEHKTNLMDFNNGWNDKNERIIISLGENSASYKWMHEKSAYFYSSFHKVLNIVLIIFTTGLSAETFLPDTTEEVYVVILRRIFTYIATLISIIMNFLKFEQLSEQHTSAGLKFSELYHDIQKQMCLYRRDRVNASFYISKILKLYDSIFINNPKVNSLVVSQFKRTFGNSNIAVPDIADNIQKIEIIEEQSAKTSGAFRIKNIRPSTKEETVSSKMCNLEQIHNAFQIHGDITDEDIQNASSYALKELRKKFLKEKSNFEYQRYLNHTLDMD